VIIDILDMMSGLSKCRQCPSKPWGLHCRRFASVQCEYGS